MQKKLAKEVADLEKIKQVIAGKPSNPIHHPHFATLSVPPRSSAVCEVSALSTVVVKEGGSEENVSREPGGANIVDTSNNFSSEFNDGSSNNSASGNAAASTAASRLPTEFNTIQRSIQSLQEEIEKRQKTRQYELSHIEVIQNFMKEVAWLVKPQVVDDNADVMQLGAPLSPELFIEFFHSVAGQHEDNVGDSGQQKQTQDNGEDKHNASSPITIDSQKEGNDILSNTHPLSDIAITGVALQNDDAATTTTTENIHSNNVFSITPDDVVRSFPKDFPTYGLLMRDLSFKMTHGGLLPESVQNLYTKASSWNIDHIEDVMMVKDAFRWLSWCNLVLHLLRYPTNTPLLRQVLDVTKTLRVVDEKIVKLLTQVLQKAR